MKGRAALGTPAGLLVLLLAIQAVGIWAGRVFLPAASQGGLFNRLLAWDGRIYFDIAQQGYGWNPARPLEHQNIAFFPGQVLLDKGGALLLGHASPMPALLLSLGFGAACVFAFHGLARALLKPREAGFATALFAFWPASCFFIMGYPTGLISLCVIGALGARLRRHDWRAALWCGLGSALAPTIMFVVAALYLERALALPRQGVTPGRMLHLAGWALLCVSGLLGFMLYQQWRFADALAFIHAQAAWGTAPALTQRLHRLVDWHWYIQQANAGRQEIIQGLGLWRQGQKLPGMTAMEAGLQRWTNSVSLVVAVPGLVAASFGLWRRGAIIPVAGWCVFAGYVWFIFSTDQNMLCVPRLLYPAIALFLGFGLIAGRLPGFLGGVVLLLSLLAAGLEAAFAAGGYWVV